MSGSFRFYIDFRHFEFGILEFVFRPPTPLAPLPPRAGTKRVCLGLREKKVRNLMYHKHLGRESFFSREITVRRIPATPCVATTLDLEQPFGVETNPAPSVSRPDQQTHFLALDDLVPGNPLH